MVAAFLGLPVILGLHRGCPDAHVLLRECVNSSFTDRNLCV